MILIDRKKPQNCWECFALDREYGECNITGENVICDMPLHCPLKEVGDVDTVVLAQWVELMTIEVKRDCGNCKHCKRQESVLWKNCEIDGWVCFPPEKTRECQHKEENE